MKLVLLGAPGSGKGTQAEKLSASLGIPTISTGAIIREQINAKTELGLKATGYIAEGQLVPDELIIDIVINRLNQDDCKDGYILDGFPRTIPQAEAAERLGLNIDKVLDIYVPDEAIVDRLSGRRECRICRTPFHTIYNAPTIPGVCDKCGGELIRRADDEPETIKKRLVVYHNETEPLEEFYRQRGILTVVEGRKRIEDTTHDVRVALGLE